MSLPELFQAQPLFFVTTMALVGAMVGSFLNVVIHRLPLMMDRQWRQQCAELEGRPLAGEDNEPLDLARPASRCPHCDHAIRAWENIPLVSYLLLRGKCSACGRPISPRYPLIEAATALLSAFIAWHFGFGWAAAAALVLTWSLIALCFIDLDRQLLPDNITLPVLWLGLTCSLFGLYTDTASSLIGAMAGYLSLWSIYWLFKLATGKEGMGYGDFKLLALLGAWMGWQFLPLVLLASSLVGALIGIMMILFRGHQRQAPIPFGPYLAIAGWITFIWGEEITGAYLQFIKLG